MEHDYDTLLWEQMGQLADLAKNLDEADWDHASLCDGWRMEGLAFSATDVDWSTGDGPEVRGTAEALLLSMGNRDVAVGELEGEGAATFASRVGAGAAA